MTLAPDSPSLKANLRRLLRPRHVAVLGGVDAETVAGECRRIGYDGPFWPVNPKRETIGGFACFPSVDDLPEPPDAVFIAVPREQAIDSLARLSAMGAGGAIIYTAGFAEIGGDGPAMEAALIEAAGDMAIIGPNCYGLINYVDRVALWPFAHGGGFQGRGAAIITQSGMLSSDLTMAQRGLPLSYMLSVGNQAVLRIEDFIDTLADLPEVSAIGVHIEGIRDPQRFQAAALRALANNVPLVGLKTGTSALGSELTVSHTGSLSGADEVYDAFFDRLGMIRVTEPSEMLETLKFLTVAGVPAGRRLAGLACSGGGATMLADAAEAHGLDLPRPSAATAERLRTQLPLTATVSNPLDYTTPIWGVPDKTEPVFSTLFADGYDAAVIIQDYPAAGLDESKPFYRNDSISFLNAAAAVGLPAAVCSTIAENLDAETRAFLVAKNVAPMQGIGDCVRAIAAAARYGAARQRLLADPPPPLILDDPNLNKPNLDDTNLNDKHLDDPNLNDKHLDDTPPISDAGTSGPAMLDEAVAKSLLSSWQIAVPPSFILADLPAQTQMPPALPPGLDYPLVAKALSPDLPHKSESGAVILNIGSGDELLAALATIDANLTQHAPTARRTGYLIEAMQPSPLGELMLSLRRDPAFGLVLTLASGGVLVELLGDAVTLVVPASDDVIAAAIDRLAMARILRGYRGGDVADLAPLITAINQLTTALADDPSLSLVEINPLFVGTDGVTAVDAVITRQSHGSHAAIMR
jgi:acyl-CoA synthetase (NDP forming)